MKAFRFEYQFRDQVKMVVMPAETREEAVRKFGAPHIQATITEIETDVRAAYLKSADGAQFVELLRHFENTLYVKVRNPDKFFEWYTLATGEKISGLTPRVLISTQENKWGDEMSIRFNLGDATFNFPSDAHPRIENASTGEAILNDNEYIKFLIANHGFRFGR